MLHECLKLELAPMGVSVSAAKPGAVDTRILQLARDASTDVFPDADEIRMLYQDGKVVSAETAASFLSWLLLDVSAEQFSARLWDLRTDMPV